VGGDSKELSLEEELVSVYVVGEPEVKLKFCVTISFMAENEGLGRWGNALSSAGYCVASIMTVSELPCEQGAESD